MDSGNELLFLNTVMKFRKTREKFDNDGMCPICYHSILDENNIILHCNHEFCLSCLTKLLNQDNPCKKNCPLCDKPLF